MEDLTLRNLIHALELKLQHFEVSRYVCIGSRIYAIFAHKKNYGRAGYVDDLLPNIAHIAIWDACLHCVALLYTELNSVVVFGPFCLLIVWSLWKKKILICLDYAE